MREVNPTSSVFKLNLSELKTPIKIQLAGQIKINDTTICCRQETHIIFKDTKMLKVKG